VVKIYDEGETFTPGKAKLLREGSGRCNHCLRLAGFGGADWRRISSPRRELRRAYWIALRFSRSTRTVSSESAQATGCVVTAENHNVIGGLGSAVADALGERAPVPMERVGVKTPLARSARRRI
jgi:transketolase